MESNHSKKRQPARLNCWLLWRMERSCLAAFPLGVASSARCRFSQPFPSGLRPLLGVVFLTHTRIFQRKLAPEDGGKSQIANWWARVTVTFGAKHVPRYCSSLVYTSHPCGTLSLFLSL